MQYKLIKLLYMWMWASGTRMQYKLIKLLYMWMWASGTRMQYKLIKYNYATVHVDVGQWNQNAVQID